ncbi:MAG: seg [Candidatus Adlerbacteria bacterium]|nr:seg [Candidatus Adlerbacteria bacterium]
MINKMKDIVRGFTLIETLVAVLLLTSAIAGPLTIAAKGLSSVLVARDQMVAFYLAQDGVEYVRFVRDTNKLAGGSSNWLSGDGTAQTKDLTACTGSTGCYIDPSTNVIVACPAVSSGGCPTLAKHDGGGGQKYFTYSSSDPVTPQRFVRTIIIASASAGEAVLTVAVSWRAQSGVTRVITVRENIFDWQ